MNLFWQKRPTGKLFLIQHFGSAAEDVRDDFLCLFYIEIFKEEMCVLFRVGGVWLYSIILYYKLASRYLTRSLPNHPGC